MIVAAKACPEPAPAIATRFCTGVAFAPSAGLTRSWGGDGAFRATGADGRHVEVAAVPALQHERRIDACSCEFRGEYAFMLSALNDDDAAKRQRGCDLLVLSLSCR